MSAIAPSAAADRRVHTWRTVLLAGLALWAVSTITLVATEDLILLPARLLRGFFVAGVLGLMAAAALETWLLPSRLVPNLWVGLIEEAVKLAGLAAVAWSLPNYRVRDGLILGAPVGHGVWTGLVGAALFGAGRGRAHPRIDLVVIATFLVAAGLHALWDASSNAAVVVCVLLSGDEALRETLRAGTVPAPTAIDQQLLLGAIQWMFMGMVAVAGLWLFRRAWRTAPEDARP